VKTGLLDAEFIGDTVDYSPNLSRNPYAIIQVTILFNQGYFLQARLNML